MTGLPPCTSTASSLSFASTQHSITVAHADTYSAATLDPKFVMAEQSSHNVVEKPQLTSGSPLVDAVANQTASTSPDRGAYVRPSAEITKDSPESIGDANAQATDGPAGSQVAKEAAEPSAGDAADTAALAQAPAPINATKGEPVAVELPNGARDDTSQGEGLADDRSTADLSVDISIYSDTDNSKADNAEKKEGTNHVRTNSVKKPTTFSRVTATKSFMSKVAPAAPVAPKVGEKRKIRSDTWQGKCTS